MFSSSCDTTHTFVFMCVFTFYVSPLLIRSVLSGHSLLFPGRGGLAPKTKRGGGLAGLVPLPRTHLLPSADDGSGFVPVGCSESQQKLHPRYRLQSSLKERLLQQLTPEQPTCQRTFLKKKKKTWLRRDIN